MSYDTEKTQAPSDSREVEREERFTRRERDLAGNIIKGGPATGYGLAQLSDDEILARLFSYHPPTVETLPRFQAINQAAKNFAEVVLQNCPAGADRSAAIRQIRDARMTANAAIALNGLSL